MVNAVYTLFYSAKMQSKVNQICLFTSIRFKAKQLI